MVQSQSGMASWQRSTSGSGALSHAYVQYPPLRCNIPGNNGLHYDDGNKLIIASTLTQIFTWQVGQFTSVDTPNAFTVNEGPVLCVKFSLNGKIMAIQRSQQEVEIIIVETSQILKHQCTTESEFILGFFWTDCPTCNIVFVKTSGLELYSLNSGSNALKLVEAKRFSVSWFIYTHESRLVLLASGMQNKSLMGFQFSAGGIIRLPKFEAMMTKAEVNNKPILGQEDVYIATMYGRIYCLQVDREGMQLILYRFYRDAVVNQGSLPIYSNKVAISVVDNVLLVHQVDAKVVLLYDIFADSKAPISAPLPLLVRGPSGSVMVSSRNKDKSPGSSSLPSDQLDNSATNEVCVYGEGWVFLNPDLICDNIHGLLWKISLDLEAISASSSEVPSLLAFLQRRRLEADKAKKLTLAVMRSVILERRTLMVILSAIEIITLSYAHAMRLANYLPGPSETGNVNRTANQSKQNTLKNEGDIMQKTDIETTRNSLILRESSNNSLSDIDSPGNTNFGQDDAAGSSSKIDGNQSVANKDKNNADPFVNDVMPAGVDDRRILGATRSSETVLTSLNKPRVASTVISPDEMFKDVFSIVEEEMSGDPMYLVAVIVEYLRSTAAENLQVPPGLQVLLVQLLARDERYAELEHFILSKIIEPSKEVAIQLVNIGINHLSVQKLGMEMLRQLSCHSEYVSLLLKDGRFIEALRYVRRNKVLTIPPVLFLEAAVDTKDAPKLAACLRFCRDFVPNFEQTSDHSRFITILNEMSSSVVA